MLRNYLTSLPCSKFILIEGNIAERGKPLFDFLINHHISKSDSTIHYFVFQENLNKVKEKFQSKNNVIVHNCISNLKWNNVKEDETFSQVLLQLGSRDVVVVDSLVHVIYQYGLHEAYKVLNLAKNQTGIMQIICLLHLDLIEKKLKVNEVFEHLCTLCLSMQPKFNGENKRIKYVYKKLGGRVISETEEYFFEDNQFFTQKIDKIDVKKLLENTTNEVDPETLSTFRIGLNAEEKKARDQLVLPYLPTPPNQSSEGGNIFYKFDQEDDWDEEDPDDDLDI